VERRPTTGLIVALALCVATLTPGLASAHTASPPVSTTTPSAGPARSLPTRDQPLEPGRYVSRAFGPALAFDLATDGWSGQEAAGQYLQLERQMGDAQGVLSVSLFDGLVAPDPCQPVADGQVDKTAAAVTEWLTGLAALSTSTTPVTLAGLPATQVDVTVIGSRCPASPYLSLWDGFRLFPSEAAKVIALDHDGQVLIVAAETIQSTDIADFMDVAGPVLDSLTIGDGDPAALAPSAPPAAPAPSAPPA
jgi:hypothetical protein